MKKMSIEAMEQLLKDLAANVGYELIPNPFNTPFEESSLEILPDDKQFIWPVPASVLNDEAHKDFRKMWVEADLIDTVAELSWSWLSNEEDHIAILLIDLTRSRRGTVKFVDATAWDISDETGMAAVCNFLIHDLFPGEHLLAFGMNEDAMDLEVDERWDEQVCILAVSDNESLLPSSYIYKMERREDSDILGAFFDIKRFSLKDDGIRLEKSAVVISTMGKLNPLKIEYKGVPISLSLKDKILLVPEEDCYDLNRVVEMFDKEEVLRQLPISRRLSWNDLFNLKINYRDFLAVSEEEWHKIRFKDFDKQFESFFESFGSKCTSGDSTNNYQ